MNQLPKVKTGGKRRVGRGYGSRAGGHTTGRGQKGQGSRNSVHILFEGVKTKKSLVRRLPFLRGKGKFKSAIGPVPVNVEELNSFRSGSTVDIDTLIKEGMVDGRQVQARGVKVLGRGKLDKKLQVNLPASKIAKEKVEGAGGKII